MTMELTGMGLTIIMEPLYQLTRELTEEEAASLPVPGHSLIDAIGSYLETLQVLSRIF